MLGFTWNQAVEYARDRRWKIHHTTKAFTDDDGGRIMHLQGTEAYDEVYLRGVEIEQGGIIKGPLKVHPRVAEFAVERVR
jgi:hypothetical protein